LNQAKNNKRPNKNINKTSKLIIRTQKPKNISKMNNYDYMVKIIIIGDSAVGKSNVLLRFTEEKYRTVHTATIGVDFKVKILDVGKHRLKMTIWDTAGQDRFQNITTTYYKGAQGVILMYSISDRRSF
jgi:Ras-related protein Rab-8A